MLNISHTPNPYIRGMKHCKWCGKKTTNEEQYLPTIPIQEDIEGLIDELGREKVWDGNANWDEEEMDPILEAILMTYDELVFTMSKKVVCKECIAEDEKLWDKYYGGRDEIEWQVDVENTEEFIKLIQEGIEREKDVGVEDPILERLRNLGFQILGDEINLEDEEE